MGPAGGKGLSRKPDWKLRKMWGDSCIDKSGHGGKRRVRMKVEDGDLKVLFRDGS